MSTNITRWASIELLWLAFATVHRRASCINIVHLNFIVIYYGLMDITLLGIHYECIHNRQLIGMPFVNEHNLNSLTAANILVVCIQIQYTDNFTDVYLTEIWYVCLLWMNIILNITHICLNDPAYLQIFQWIR